MRFDEIYMYCIYMYEMKIPVNICLDIKQFSSLSDILFFYISIFHLTNTLSICGFILLSVFVMSLSTLSTQQWNLLQPCLKPQSAHSHISI